MNERIRQLARDSHMVEVVCSQKSVKVNYPKNFEKFAELIVKECMAIGFHTVYKVDNDNAAVAVYQNIKEHFGVE
jgi:hypothetical protein